MNDTNTKIQMKCDEMMMSRTGVERLKMGLSMFDMAKRLVVASIVSSGKGGDIQRQLLLRFYQSDLDLKTINKILETIKKTGDVYYQP